MLQSSIGLYSQFTHFSFFFSRLALLGHCCSYLHFSLSFPADEFACFRGSWHWTHQCLGSIYPFSPLRSLSLSLSPSLPLSLPLSLSLPPSLSLSTSLSLSLSLSTLYLSLPLTRSLTHSLSLSLSLALSLSLSPLPITPRFHERRAGRLRPSIFTMFNLPINKTSFQIILRDYLEPHWSCPRFWNDTWC